MGMPHTFDCFGSIYGYEYRTHKWIYDVKFYLNGDMWCLDEEGEKPLRKVEEDELKIIEQHKHIIEEHERENATWLAHKQCRKRSCVCKNVKNIVIAIIVWRKLMTVIVLKNKLRMECYNENQV